jgi:hypothetical protein
MVRSASLRRGLNRVQGVEIEPRGAGSEDPTSTSPGPEPLPETKPPKGGSIPQVMARLNRLRGSAARVIRNLDPVKEFIGRLSRRAGANRSRLRRTWEHPITAERDESTAEARNGQVEHVAAHVPIFALKRRNQSSRAFAQTRAVLATQFQGLFQLDLLARGHRGRRAILPSC